MYTRYFGFNEKPFTLTPNPRFIFLSKNHKEAFAHLLYGINNHYGFIALTGEVGTGKTTILRTLLGQLQDELYRTALIFSPCLTSIELLRCINSEFGIDATSEYANELLAELNRFLLAETAAGRTVVLVIDESQNLQPEVLEHIRLISNLETENDKLIQIILAGQPELDALLDRPDLRQLNQRIAVRYKLQSMSLAETRSYIRQRMEVAGETGGVSFTRAATALIYLSTRGVPRMINILCDRTLLIAYGDERRRITAGIVVRGTWELLNRSEGRRLSLVSAGIVMFALIAVLAGIGISLLPSRTPARQPLFASAIKAAGTPTGGSAAVNTEQSSKMAAQTKLEQEIASYDQNDTHVQVFNTLAAGWGVRPIKVFSEGLDIPDMFRRIAAKRNLRVTLFKGSLEDVIRFDLPFIVATRVTGDLGEYCYAVMAVKNGSLSVYPALLDSHTLPRTELSSIASGTYYLVWQNSGQIPDTMSLGEKRGEVRSLQQLLKQAGVYQDPLDGIYGISTASAVRQFQQTAGIPPNETLGELTLAALSRYNTNHKVPSLKGSL